VTRLGPGLLAVAVGIVALLFTLWVAQRRLIYFPSGGRPPHPAEVGLESAREVVVQTDDGIDLGAWFVEPSSPAIGWTLILFNGNAGNRAVRAPLARKLAARGVCVLMVDYRGYAGNRGAPSEDGLTRDARAARRWAAEHAVGAGWKVAYMGESLGTGVAVALAAERAPDALILRSPFTSLADVGSHHYPILPVRLLLRDRYASVDRIRELPCPVLVVAAEHDSIVPVRLSRRLFEAAPPDRRRWFLLPAADHNDYETLAGDAVTGEIVRFLGEARQGPLRPAPGVR